MKIQMKNILIIVAALFSTLTFAEVEVCGKVTKLRPGSQLDPIYETPTVLATKVLVGELDVNQMRVIAHTEAEIAIVQSAFLAHLPICGVPTDDKLISVFYTKH